MKFLKIIIEFFDRSSPSFCTKISLLLCALLAISGIVLGNIEDSYAVLANGLISTIDIGISITFLLALNKSIKSPDNFFNYGYGKYEGLTILFTGLIVLTLYGFSLINIFNNLKEIDEIGNNYLLIGFSILSYFSMLQMSKTLKNASNKYHIPLLKYDADLWKTDSYLEIGVILSLIAGIILSKINLVPLAHYIDLSVAAILILFSIKTPFKHIKIALNQLLDKTLPEEIQLEIKKIIENNAHKVCGLEAIHTRQSGKDIFIDLDVMMPNNYTLNEVNETEEELEFAFKEKYPTSLPRFNATTCKRTCNEHEKNICPIKLKMRHTK
jgi:cation diffusion facilitator family transporter